MISFCTEAVSSIFYFKKNSISFVDNNEDQQEKDSDEKGSCSKEFTRQVSLDFDIFFINNQSFATHIHNRLSEPYLSLELRPPQVYS